MPSTQSRASSRKKKPRHNGAAPNKLERPGLNIDKSKSMKTKPASISSDSQSGGSEIVEAAGNQIACEQPESVSTHTENDSFIFPPGVVPEMSRSAMSQSQISQASAATGETANKTGQ